MGPMGSAEFVSEYEAYMANAPAGTPKTVQELIEASEDLADTEHPVNPARIGGYEQSLEDAKKLDSPEVQTILTDTMPALRSELEALMASNGVQALMFPTMTCPASVTHDQTDDTYTCDSEDTYAGSYIAPSTHMPELAVPAGLDRNGLPIGMSFLGPLNSEGTLLSLGAAWEAISPFDFNETPTALNK